MDRPGLSVKIFCAVTGRMLFFVLLMVLGASLFVAGSAKSLRDRVKKERDVLLTDGDDAHLDDTRVVYKYLPRDLDEFYREDDPAFTPSKLYSGMFVDNNDLRRGK